MKRRILLRSALLVIVIAAAYAILLTLRTLGLTPVTLSSQSVGTPALEQARASNPAGGTIMLLAFTENENGVGFQARPADPTTLADLPGYAPINFGHHYTYAVSADRKTLAVITWPSDSHNAEGALHLIDLDTWADTPADLRIDDYVGDLTFGTDGKTLYWTLATGHHPAHDMPRDYQLYHYDFDSRQLSVITQFPSSFIPWSLHRLLSGNLAIYGVPTDPNNLAEDVPHVLIIDPAGKRIAADARLDGAKAGQFREKVTTQTPSPQGESWQYMSYAPGWAWDLERSLLYVVHADEDKVTVVDLAKEALIRQTAIHLQQSFLESILGSLIPTAEAKSVSGPVVRAMLSRDGKRLYVFSQKMERGELRAANLRVIATDGMRQISRLDELLTDFALTPDGQSLLAIKGEIVSPYGFDRMVSRDVYVFDAETLRERALARAEQVDQLWFRGFSPDGRYAYVHGASAQRVEGSGWRDWRTTWYLLDLNSYSLILAGESGRGYLPIVP